MFDVQLMGGIVLHEGDVAEMKTGEGKTFVASLALYLNALPTVDDATTAASSARASTSSPSTTTSPSATPSGTAASTSGSG